MKAICTNGVKTLLLDLMPAFERKGGAKPAINWGATANLVILTAESIDDLSRKGMVVAGSRVDIASSGIGLAVRKGASKPDISTPDALKAALLTAKSVSHSKSGMSGIYFPTVLARLGIAEQMKSKIVMPEPGTPVGE